MKSQNSWLYPLIVLAAVLVCVATARAAPDAGATSNSAPPARASGTARKRLYLSPAQKNPGSIHGQCIVVETLGNPITSPCVNLLLILNDDQGAQVEQTRTTGEGKFAFSGKAGKLYTIVPGSRLYEVTAPEHPIKGGSNIELKLRAK